MMSDTRMTEFVSETIHPHAGTFDAQGMGRGEPGLPQGFDWQGRSFTIVERLAVWKESSREGARAQGELYLRRHYYRLRMSDDSVWTVYFVRQTPRSGSPKMRWFLYSMDRQAPGRCVDATRYLPVLPRRQAGSGRCRAHRHE